MPTERAGYVATIFLVDVSPSMGILRTIEVPNPDGETKQAEMTKLQWALQYVLYKVQEMIFHGRKTEQCGVILFGTEQTDNIIYESAGGYEHVTEFIPIAQPNASTITKLQSLQASSVSGDPIDALIVGIEAQDKYLGKHKTWSRRIVLLTDSESPIEIEDWKLTVKKINELRISMSIIGIDFDDEEYGFKEEYKTKIKRENEKFFHEFVRSADHGVIGNAAYALQECVSPEMKLVKSALLGTTLRLGDVDIRLEEAIELPVKMSKCTAVVRPPPLKKFAMRRSAPDQSTSKDAGEDVYAQLDMQTEYFIGNYRAGDQEEDKDEEKSDEESGEKVDKEQLIRGFKYGASFVPCPDGQFARLNTRKGMDILGFFPEKLLRRDFAMGEVQYVWADPSSGQSQVSFSSIVRAMLSREVVAVTRWISRDEMDPKMGLLIPRDFEKVDCFLWLQMPFADDVRRYAFPPLQNLVTKNGEHVEKHPFLPTETQQGKMDNFVDAMDLMQAGEKGEDGKRAPWFDPRLSYNLAVHRIKQALFHAAIVTDLRSNPLPPPHPEITKYLKPPRRVLKRAQDAIDECKTAFNIKPVPRRIKRFRKDGHVQAEHDDEDEPLLLDRPSKPPRSQNPTRNAASEDMQPVSENRTLASHADIKGLAGSIIDRQSQGAEPLLERTENQSQYASPYASQEYNESQELPEEHPPRRLVSAAYPLEDFKKAKVNNIRKALEDLGFVLKDVVLRPFAAKRREEFIRCMQEMRKSSLEEGEVDIWNSFLKELKEICTRPEDGNEGFWNSVCDLGPSISLIKRSEATKAGTDSGTTDSDVEGFLE